MRRLVVLSVVAGWLFASGGAGAQVPRPDEQKIITNYWRHIQSLLETEWSKPIKPPRVEVRYPPPKHYPFSAFAHLNAADLITAAQEGAKYARKRNQNKPEEEVARLVRANVRTAFEYYPVLAVDDDDKKRMLTAMERETEDPILRVYLIDSAFGRTPRSQFASYMQEVVQEFSDDTREILSRIISVAHEPALVQTAAIEARYAQAYGAFQEILRRDPNVQRFEEETGTTATPQMLLGESPFTLERSTQLVLQRRSGDFDRLIADMGTNLERRSAETLPVKRKVLEVIQRALDTVPLQNPDAARAMLEKHAALLEEGAPSAAS